ncbi:hairy and enhancer of split transcription factor C [Apostichopus japonicus]|uniref:Hairy and enhancer of split transcription factor C n=1 Tax=Stichopus japonicus TaxID=307972 RepID=A0A2G8JJ82_STIJA|nr:hairy and enhancer of split transcription factor C [Apostichopus japonicus]
MATVILNSDVRQHKRRPRINKHLTERRRRARINDSLFQLKNLVFPALENKVSQNSKVEKADILEMTLLYLRGLQKQALTNQGQQPTVNHFQAGFSECLGEVSHFLLSCDSIDTNTRIQLLNHVASRTTNMHSPPTPTHASSISPPAARHNRSATEVTTLSNKKLTVEVQPTVQQSWNGSPYSLMTPPTSPMESAGRSFARNGLKMAHSAFDGKNNVVSGHMLPVWRPWLE